MHDWQQKEISTEAAARYRRLAEKKYNAQIITDPCGAFEIAFQEPQAKSSYDDSEYYIRFIEFNIGRTMVLRTRYPMHAGMGAAGAIGLAPRRGFA